MSVREGEPVAPSPAELHAKAERVGIHRLSIPTPFLVGRVNC